MRSLERRLLFGLSTLLVLLFAGLLWGSVAVLESLSKAYVDTRLAHDAEALLGALRVTPTGRLRVNEGRLTPVYQQPLSGHYFVFSFGDGRQLRSRSLWDETLLTNSLQAGEIQEGVQPGPDGQVLQTRVAGYTKNDMRFTLLVAEDIAALQSQIRRYQFIAVAVMAVALVVFILVQRAVLRRGFVAVDEVRDEVQRVVEGSRQQVTTMGPLELQPLVVEINRLLAHQRRRLQRSRQAFGNLTHALKGPLTLLTRDVDGMPDTGPAKPRLLAQVERLSALIERELKRARLGGEVSAQRFVPARDVPELLDALRQLYQSRGLHIRASELPAEPLPFDREDMLEILGNLLDNACKWAGSEVRLALRVVDGLAIRVEDDGPGIVEAEREQLLLRGSRLDEQRPGHGLGLAIVHDLVGELQGTISLGDSQLLGGLAVDVRLPS